MVYNSLIKLLGAYMIFTYSKYKEICDDFSARLSGIVSRCSPDIQNMEDFEKKCTNINYHSLKLFLLFEDSRFKKAFFNVFRSFESLSHGNSDYTFVLDFVTYKRDERILSPEGRESLFCDLLITLDNVIDEYVANNCTNQEGRYPETLQLVAEKTGKSKDAIDAEVKKYFQRLANECKGPLSLSEKHAKFMEIKELYEAIRDKEKLEVFCRKNMSKQISHAFPVTVFNQPRITEESTPSLSTGDELYKIAEQFGKKGNDVKALMYVRRAHEKGSISATTTLGVFLLQGTGGPCNKKEGERYLRIAIDAGNARAMYSLGRMFEKGYSENGCIDYNEALNWYQKALNIKPEELLYQQKVAALTELVNFSSLNSKKI